MKLREKVAFDAITAAPDGSGGHERTWGEQHVCRAEFIYSRGSEAVNAARLQGRSIYKVKISSCAAARSISTDHRMRDVRRDVEYQIREVDVVTEPKWVFLIVESGVAT